MSEDLPGVNIPVEATISVDSSGIATDLSSLTKEFSKSGRDAAKGFSKSFDSSLSGLKQTFKDTFANLEGNKIPGVDARVKVLNDLADEVRRTATEYAKANDSITDSSARTARATVTDARKVAEAARDIGAAYRQASEDQRKASSTSYGMKFGGTSSATNTATSGINDAKAAGSAFEAMLARLLTQAQKLPPSFDAIMKAIVADLSLASKEISETIVAAQGKMQADGIAKQQAKDLAQQQAAANRVLLQEQRAADREQEQVRQQAHRIELADHKSQNAQVNSIINAGLQQELIEEKGHQQRRTALIQAGLLATRSLYQSTSSGVESVYRSIYNTLTSITRSGEDEITATQRSGLLRRNAQSESLMKQQTAQARAQMTLYQKTQDDLNTGVVGAVAGTSAAGAGLRNLALGFGGALSVVALAKTSDAAEANLRVFRELNPEVAKSDTLFKELQQTSQDLGNDIALPGVSAADAAAALTSLAKTGLSVQDSIGAARGTLLLARTAGLDFSEAARTIGSTLNALGLEGDQATRVVDGFQAALANAGGATFDELRQAQQQALLVFRNAFSFAEDDPVKVMDQLNASLALFSRNALRGSDAGTSLKTFTAALVGTSGLQAGNIQDLLESIGESNNFLFDGAGNARKFADSIALVRKAFLSLEPDERVTRMREIFGSDAVRAAQIFVDTSQAELDDLMNKVGGDVDGITLRIAKAMNQGIFAGLDVLQSTIETIFGNIYRVINVPIGNFLTGVADAISTFASSPAFETARQALLGIAAGLAAILAAKAALEVLQLLGTVLTSLATPMGAVLLGAAAIGGAFALLYKNSDAVREFVSNLGDNLRKVAGSIKSFVAPVIAGAFGAINEAINRVTEGAQGLFTLLSSGEFTKAFGDAFGVTEDSGLVSGLLTIRQGAIDAFNGIVAAAKTAWASISEVVGAGITEVQDLLQRINLAPFIDRLSEIGGRVRDSLVNAFGFVTSFVQALASTIDVVGVAEGLRQAFSVVIDGILGIFSGIGSAISNVFSRINWSNVATAILTGIYSVFREVAFRISSFLLSDQFLATVLVALTTVAAVLGSALAGVVTGLADGISGSDLAGRIGDVLGAALEEGFKLALSLLNPVQIIADLFTNPFGSAIRAAAVVVGGLFAVKIIGAIVSGMKTIGQNVAGVRTSFQVFTGGIESVAKSSQEARREQALHAASVKNISAQYGTFGGKAIAAADTIGKLRDKLIGLVTPAQRVDTAVTGAGDRIREGFGRSAYSPVENFTNKLSDLNEKFQLTSQLASGVAAGGGLGVALGSDNAVAKIAGVTGALVGLSQQYTTTVQVMSTSGLAAGLATGGIGLAVTAISTLGAYLLTASQKSKKAAEDAKAQVKEYAGAFKQIVEAGNGSKAAQTLEFFSQLNDSSNATFDDLRDNAHAAGRNMKDLAAAVVGSGDSWKQYSAGVSKELASVNKQIRAGELAQQALSFSAAGGTSTQAQIDASNAAIAAAPALERQRDALEGIATNAKSARDAYKTSLEDGDRELFIRNQINQLEEKRKSSIEKNVEKRRGERDLLDEIRQQLLDISDIESGNAGGVGERAAREARTALRGFVDEFTNEVTGPDGAISKAFNGEAIAKGLNLGDTSAEADKARAAFAQLASPIAEVVSQLANAQLTTEQFKGGVDLVRQSYINLLTEGGVAADQAAQVVDSILNPLLQADPTRVAFIERISEGLKGLQTQIKRDGLDNIGFVANLDDKPMQETINAFLKEPTAKNVEALLNLGVPQNQLEAFINHPDEKTLGFVVTPDDQAAFDAYVAENITKPVDIPTTVTPPPPVTAQDFLHNLFGGSDPRTWNGQSIIIPAETAVPEMPPLPFQLPGFVNPELQVDPKVNTGPVDEYIARTNQTHSKPFVDPTLDPTSKGVVDAYLGALKLGVTVPVTFVPSDPTGLFAFIQNPIGKPIPGKKLPASANGRIVTRPMVSTLGEGYRKEVVIPLTKPDRAAELFQQSGLAQVLGRSNAYKSNVATATKNSDPKMGSLINEVQGLRADIRDYSGQPIEIHSNDPRAVVSELDRKRRRRKLGIR